jgi:hypothetical protein
MSPQNPQALAGQARVKLKTGETYVGHVTYDGKLVTIAGRLEHVSLVDGESVVSYREAPRFTVSYWQLEKIVWEDDEKSSDVF